MMTLLVFAVALLCAVLVSKLADRSILSTAVLFLAIGFLAGDGVFQLLSLQPQDPIVHQLAEIALFSVLFTDGMRVNARGLASAWHLPGRALLFGMPLTALGTTLLCHYLAGFAWMESLLLGAILSPTDPVFAAAIMGRKEIPARLRHLLNVESGVNDGLALPAVLVLIAVLTGQSPELPKVLGELAMGTGLGILVPWLACKIEHSRLFSVSQSHEPLFPVAIGLLLYAIASLTHGNLYLAAFAGGVTTATIQPRFSEQFHSFGELVTELLKLAALLVFGSLITPAALGDVHPGGYAVAVLTLLLVRPAALYAALVGSRLTRPERLAAGWFGPKGFASAIYGLLLFSNHVPNALHLFHFTAAVIALSITAHSSTDVLLAKWFRRSAGEKPEPAG